MMEIYVHSGINLFWMFVDEYDGHSLEDQNYEKYEVPADVEDIDQWLYEQYEQGIICV